MRRQKNYTRIFQTGYGRADPYRGERGEGGGNKTQTKKHSYLRFMLGYLFRLLKISYWHYFCLLSYLFTFLQPMTIKITIT